MTESGPAGGRPAPAPGEGSPPRSAAPLSFSYHRALAPMLWMFIAIALAELLLVHALVALWRPRLALALSLLSVSGIVWLVRLVRSFRTHPVLIEEDAVRFRLGRLREVVVPIERIAGLRTSWAPRFHKQKQVLNLALLSFPNILVELDEPVRSERRRPIRAVAHRLDDPQGFGRGLRERLAAGRSPAAPVWFG